MHRNPERACLGVERRRLGCFGCGIRMHGVRAERRVGREAHGCGAEAFGRGQSRSPRRARGRAAGDPGAVVVGGASGAALRLARGARAKCRGSRRAVRNSRARSGGRWHRPSRGSRRLRRWGSRPGFTRSRGADRAKREPRGGTPGTGARRSCAAGGPAGPRGSRCPGARRLRCSTPPTRLLPARAAGCAAAGQTVLRARLERRVGMGRGCFPRRNLAGGMGNDSETCARGGDQSPALSDAGARESVDAGEKCRDLARASSGPWPAAQVKALPRAGFVGARARASKDAGQLVAVDSIAALARAEERVE